MNERDARIRYLGRQGAITLAFRDLTKVPPAERPAMGAALNDLKAAVEALLQARADALRRDAQPARLRTEAIDITLPGRRPPLGRTHILTRTMEEIGQIFRGLGFAIVEGPEVVRDEENFERLNMPAYHPARAAGGEARVAEDAIDVAGCGTVGIEQTHAALVGVRSRDNRGELT